MRFFNKIFIITKIEIFIPIYENYQPYSLACEKDKSRLIQIYLTFFKSPFIQK